MPFKFPPFSLTTVVVKVVTSVSPIESIVGGDKGDLGVRQGQPSQQVEAPEARAEETKITYTFLFPALPPSFSFVLPVPPFLYEHGIQRPTARLYKWIGKTGDSLRAKGKEAGSKTVGRICDRNLGGG
jgi:hypothetical protein